jgi:hypothetical protein
MPKMQRKFVNLGSMTGRWMKIKSKKCCKSDEDLARLLIQRYSCVLQIFLLSCSYYYKLFRTFFTDRESGNSLNFLDNNMKFLQKGKKILKKYFTSLEFFLCL